MYRRAILLPLAFLLFSACYRPSQYAPPQIQPVPDHHSVTSGNAALPNTPSVREERFQRMVQAIKMYLGTPYQYGGASRRGIDCSGLVMNVYQKALGLQLPHSTTGLAQLGVPVSVRGLVFGDLLFFQNDGSPDVGHVGIYLYDTKFVHSSRKGVVISDFSRETYYRKNFLEARRIVNLW